MYITANFLKKNHACPNAISRFRKVFGEKVKITPKNIEKAISFDFGLFWLVSKLKWKLYCRSHEDNSVVREINKLYNWGRRIYTFREIDGTVLMLLADYMDKEKIKI